LKAVKHPKKKEREKLEPALIDKVYDYLKEHEKAGVRQIAKDLNFENSTVIKILIELKRLDKVKLILESGRASGLGKSDGE